jgi:hypothetical protein
LRKNIRETNNFIKTAEEEMNIQSEAIIPVLGLINIVAKAPKFTETAT